MSEKAGIRSLGVLIGVVSVFCFCADIASAEKTKEKFSPAAPCRTKFTINDNWRFAGSDISAAEAGDFNDSGWEMVNIPHTWNAKDPFDDDAEYRRGVSWYRKHISLSDSLKGKRLYLYFEGANQNTDVFVNGRFVGRHKGGYSGFVFDITDKVKFDSGANDNLIAVKVDNSVDWNVPPLATIGFVLYGGIYRDVWLIATEPVHISLSDYASSGVYIDTPTVSRKEAKVRIRGIAANDGNEPANVRIVNTIVDKDGKKVGTAESLLVIEPNQQSKFEQAADLIQAPQLWSPDQPYLYTVYTEVYRGDKCIDRVENSLGLRWFRFDPNEGFFLNGEHLRIKGTARHQDYQGLGNALPNSLHRRDMEIIKETGMNFVRLAHYQQDPAVLQAADELGLMVWEEIPVIFFIEESDEFTTNCKNMLSELIWQHYNHPSIIMWGCMNEPLLRGPRGGKTLKDPNLPYVQFVIKLCRELDAFTRNIDPTRVTGLAINGKVYNELGMADIPQVLGWNRYDGWYGRTPEVLGSGMDTEHKDYPQRILMVSEYGAGNDSRLHSLTPDRMDYTCEWQQIYHESYFRQIKQRPYMAGASVWVQFDFGNVYNQDVMPCINNKGLFRYDRTPKDIYYLFKANYSDEPVIYIATREWNYRTGTDPNAKPGSGKHPVSQPVKIYSNLKKVELFLNGKSLGTKNTDDVCSILWEVPFEDGLNLLEARGKKDGRVFSDSVQVRFVYQAAMLADSSVPFKQLAVNVGSDVQFIGQGGLVWDGDQPYKSGGWGYIGGERRKLEERARKTYNILGTDEDAMYQRYLTGLQGYRFDVPDGDYQVELRFADYDNDKPADRIFNVDINGRSVLENLDLVAQCGPKRAFNRVFEVSANNGEGVTVEFKPVKGKPILNAIAIRRLD